MNQFANGRGLSRIVDVLETGHGAVVNSASLLAAFVIGAVFWHFVGFWGFVSDVVYAPQQTQAAAHRPLGAAELAIGQTYASAPACVALALDRATGLTSLAMCSTEASLEPNDGVAGREDFAAVMR
ncbi:MAG: hypothetical protein WC807_01245 [Hyphomicrobium sp.]|jgi:hypothetical protein